MTLQGMFDHFFGDGCSLNQFVQVKSGLDAEVRDRTSIECWSEKSPSKLEPKGLPKAIPPFREPFREPFRTPLF